MNVNNFRLGLLNSKIILSLLAFFLVSLWSISIYISGRISVDVLYIVFFSIFFTFSATGLTWWVLRKQLRLLLLAMEMLTNFTESNNDNYPQPLPETSRNENGNLIQKINRLLTTLAQREEALRESEFRWKFAVEGSGDGLWDWNVSEGKVYYSKKWKEMLGHTETEVGHGLDEWEKRIHPEDKEKTIAVVKDYLEGKSPIYASEHRVICKDGSYKWILDRGMVVSRDIDGNPLRIIGTHKDITDRKQAEDALRKGHETLIGILDTTLDGYWCTDSMGKLINANPTYSRQSGYTYEELISMTILDLEAVESAAETTKHIERIIKYGHDQFESIHRRKDGSFWHVEVSATYRDVSGGQFFVFLRDITTRKQAEEAIHKSKQQYDNLVSKIPVGIYLVHTTPSGGFTFDFVSPRMGEMLTANAEDIMANSQLAFKAIHPDELAGFRKMNEDAIQNCQSFAWEGRLLVEGDIHWLQITSSPACLDNGDVLWHGVCVDITDRKQAEFKLIESESRLRMIIENEPECIKIIDSNGRLKQMNPAGLVMIEADSFQEVSGKLITNLIAPEYRKAFGELHKRVLSGESTQMQFEIIGLKGGRRWLETHAVPMIDKGQVVQLAITRDITDRKQAEEALIDSEERFRNFFEKNSSVMLVIDPMQGQIIDANESAAAYYGYPRFQLAQMSISEINTLSVERIAEVRLLAKRDGRNYLFFKHRLASGEIRDVEVHVTPIKNNGRSLLLSIIHDITERRQLERKLKEISIRDPLTNIFNRRYIFERLDEILSEYMRDDSIFSILIIDLDNFKSVNDTYGHQAGDFILVEFSSIIKSNLRPYDLFGRYGGEEFIVVFMNTTKEQIKTKIDGMLEIIRSHKFFYKESEINITFSGGVSDSSEYEKALISNEKIIETADNRLYQAKKSGRNKIIMV